MTEEPQTGNPLAELIFSLAIVLVGAAAFIGAGRIESYYDDMIGARFLPRIITSLIAFLGLILVVINTIKVKRIGLGIGDFRIDNTIVATVIPLILLVFLYPVCIYLFGYVISTAIIMYLALIVFRNRGQYKLIVMSAVVSIIFFYFFIKLIGVFVPPGAWFSFSPDIFFK